jgi:gas vesicle protein
MKYASTLSIVLVLVIALAAYASKKDKIELKEKQDRLELLKGEIEEVRDSFETEAARRYTLKQKGVDQRELDKQEFEQLRETQERAANDLSRVKEECLSREQIVADERKALETTKEEWSSVKGALSDVFKKEADAVLEAFPLDREIRQEALEQVRADFALRQDPSQGWDDFVAYARGGHRQRACHRDYKRRCAARPRGTNQTNHGAVRQCIRTRESTPQARHI